MHSFTPRAVMDFETYSEAGYVWTPAKPSELVWNEKQQAYVTKNYLPTWSAPRGATRKGIFAVGAAAYTAHPSAEALCLWYNLKDGHGPRFWAPCLPNPTPLFDWVRGGRVIEAHNAGFEFWVWANICVRRYGWPMPSPDWFVCSMAKAQAWALPGGLDAISKILQLKTPKIDGKSLLNQLSCPRNPTKNNPKTRTRPEDVPQRAAALYAYCLRDIQAESEASERIPDLLPAEQAFWQATLKMNVRGVAVDMDAVRNASAILDQTLETYDSRLCALTGGAVEKSSQVKRLQDWLAGRGVFMPSLDSDHIERALADDLPPDARQALDYRAKAGSASVKKLYAIERMAVNGRLHDLFIYHRARTGRDGGADVQPQNLPKAGPKIAKCVQCGRWHGAHAAVCLRCGGPLGPAGGWSYEAVPQALEDMARQDAQWIEQIYGDALLTISGCIRGMFIAGPGMDLIASDYSSIEAVVTAVLAGEQWRIDAFHRREDIYYHGAAGVTGKTYEWYKQYEAEHGAKHPDRQRIGKPCLAAETKVLTDRGYLDIVDVSVTDKLWDGVEWVSHEGIAEQGVKPVIRLDGVRITPDHLVNIGSSWTEASELATNERLRTRALENASASLPPRVRLSGEETASTWRRCIVTAAPPRTGLRSTTCVKAPQRGATLVRRRRPPLTERSGLAMRRTCRIRNIGRDCSTGFLRPSEGATTQKHDSSRTMANVALPCGRNGGKTEARSCFTSRRCRAGTTPSWRWTGQTAIGGTSRAISGLLPGRKTLSINARWRNGSNSFGSCGPASQTLSPVYDLVNAGPRKRFTIRTNTGHLIVHNCELGLGFGGWLHAWLQFDSSGTFSEDEIKANIRKWRDASPAIVEFWGGQTRGKPWAPDRHELYGLEGMAIAAIQNPGTCYNYRYITFGVKDDVLYARLPSGRYLAYHRPRLERSDKWDGQLSITFEGYNSNPQMGPIGWHRMKTYGGRLAENMVQAVARDYMRDAVLRLEAAGYPIVLRVHDEIVAEVPEGRGSVEEFEAIMSQAPAWAQGWPIRAAGGYRAKRYRKD